MSLKLPKNSPNLTTKGGRLLQASLDLEYFAREFCYTCYDDPVKGPTPVRYPLYDHVKPFLAAFLARDNVLWEKSRQMMASWTVMLCFVWSILFRRNWTATCISESGHKVDDPKHTHNSLLGKARYLFKHFPDELKELYEPGNMVVHVGGSIESTIIGETANEDAGRGGNPAALLMDECAQIRLGEEIHAAAKESCPRGRVYLGTPNGKDNLLGRLRWSARPTGLKVITTHWKQHPLRQCGPDCDPVSLDPADHHGCWYARACESFTDEQIASELNIDYGKSLKGKIWPQWSRELFTGRVKYLPGFPVYRAWDFGWECTAVVFFQVMRLHTQLGNWLSQFRVFDYLEATHEEYGFYRDACGERAKFYHNCPAVRDIGDPWMQEQTDSGGYSWGINLRKVDKAHPYQIHVTPANCRTVSPANLRQNVGKLMKVLDLEDGTRQPLLLVSADETALIEHIESYRRPTDRQGHAVREDAIKDEHSHGPDALQYGVWHLDPMREIGDPNKKVGIIGGNPPPLIEDLAAY